MKLMVRQSWTQVLNNFVDSMSANEKLKTYEELGSTSFAFGDGRSVQSTLTTEIPCHIGNIVCSLQTDVVPSNIPML